MADVAIGDWQVAEDVSKWIEILAVLIIGIAVAAALLAAVRARIGGTTDEAISAFRHQIARGLLVGLDLLIAGDVIRTVTLELTLENVAALGLIVVIRTFLAWTLVVEQEHRWPWQSR